MLEVLEQLLLRDPHGRRQLLERRGALAQRSMKALAHRLAAGRRRPRFVPAIVALTRHQPSMLAREQSGNAQRQAPSA